MVSVFVTVAAPHAVTPTITLTGVRPGAHAIEPESPAAVMLTVAVPAPNAQLTAACAGAAAPSAAMTSTRAMRSERPM